LSRDFTAGHCTNEKTGYYVTRLLHTGARYIIVRTLQRSEITALCRLWLCAVAALDETNDRADYS